MVSRDFSKKHCFGSEGNATIRVGEDRTCDVVKFKFDVTGTRYVMGSGWKQFAQRHNLEAGDCCIFEMIQREPVSFKIILTRSKDIPSLLQGFYLFIIN